MDLLARRNYSPLEIRRKLADDYPSEEIEAAIAFARESKWLPADEELAERTAVALGRKKKGHRFINQYLKSKGLPPVAKNRDHELENALALVRSKLARQLASGVSCDYEFQKKIQRLLANRGFDDETARAVIKAIAVEMTTEPAES